MRIGIFGGSFNPVHVGHLIAAECAREQANLDRVVFVPAAIPPHKQDRSLAAAERRIDMLHLAVDGHAAFTVSTIEIDRGGVSWTVETLAAHLPGFTLDVKAPLGESPEMREAIVGWLARM